LPDAARDEIHQDVGVTDLGQGLLHVFTIHESTTLAAQVASAR
jgi:hypothetical protein